MRAIAAYSLIQWILDAKNQADGYGFPFDRPNVILVRRLHMAYTKLPDTRRPNTPGDAGVERTIHKLSRDLKIISSDVSLRETIGEIERKITVFDELRDAMRIAPIGGSEGLNCDGVDADIQTIEKRVNNFCRRLRARRDASKDREYGKVLRQIDKYRDKLFCDPIVTHTPDGAISIQPHRTNNILERFFRDLKRGYRRKTGNASMGKTLKAMIADTPLVKNLENPLYMDVLLTGKPTLQERFAQIDIETVRRELRNSQETCEKIPVELKRMIGLPRFLQNLSRIFTGGAQSA
jgi:hypothetical protein